MRSTMRLFWTCSFVMFVLVIECHSVQKTSLSKNWGPQSMLYLKGKHGRRFISDVDEIISISGLRRWFNVLKGLQKLKESGLLMQQDVLIR